HTRCYRDWSSDVCSSDLMRFAAAEVGLQLYHRITTGSGDALHRADKQSAQAFRQISAPEELGWLAIFIRSFTEMHLPEISGKLRSEERRVGKEYNTRSST